MSFDKIVLLFDSFKETFSASTVTNHCLNYLKEHLPTNTKIYGVAACDGGENTAQILGEHLKMKAATVNVEGAFHQQIAVTYYYQNDEALFDVASIVGFKANLEYGLAVMRASTYGVGQLINHLVDLGFKKITIGLGGTITCDGGFGLLEALGVVFYPNNKQDKILKCDYSNVSKRFNDISFTLLCDVDNPLVGLKGAANTFSKQKGASDKEVVLLNRRLERLAKCLDEKSSHIEKTGAAGGISYALKVVTNCQLVNGASYCLDILGVNKIIDSKTLVITGEGCFDETSIEGKLYKTISILVQKAHAKLWLLVGYNQNTRVTNEQIHEKVFSCFEKQPTKKELDERAVDALNVKLIELVKNLSL